jgi:hypothetical protein
MNRALQYSKSFLATIIVSSILVLLIITPLSKANSITDESIAPTRNVTQNPKLADNENSYYQVPAYEAQNTSTLSLADHAKLLLSQGVDPDYNKSMEQICQDLFGNSTGPISNNHKSESEKLAGQLNVNDDPGPTNVQACLVVAICNYPGNLNNANNQQAFIGLTYNINNAHYDYIHYLTNDSATHQSIWEWVAWLCASYQNVDVYFIGEGYFYWFLTEGFVPYDAWNNGNIDVNSLYSSIEMVTDAVHPYDFTELRLGIGDFCQSAYFAQPFITQNYGTQYYFGNRIWIGDWNPVFSYYGWCFLTCWSYYYYCCFENSQTAFNNAHDYADTFDHPPYTPYNGCPFDYFDSWHVGGPYYAPFSFSPSWYSLNIGVYDYQYYLISNANIYVDGYWQGCGFVSIHVTPGEHDIETDPCIYDENLGYYVFPVSGNGYYDLYSDTGVPIFCG